MNGFLDKFESFKKYIKYIVILILIIVLLIIFKGCGGTNYSSVERKVEEAAIEYIKQNKIVIYGENYVELSYMKSIEGTELCSKASGAIVKNNNGKIEAEAYLSCEDYTTVIYKNKSKYVTLNSNDVILLNTGEAFNDPLYEMKKDCNVEVDGYVGSTPGVYTIKYLVYVDDKLVDTLYRKVIVSKVDTTSTISGVESLTNPTITLNGGSEITIYRNEKLTEPGYTAVDYVDGKISRKVKVEPKLSQINTSKPGTYTIVYSVTNSRGNMAIATRTINVIDRNIDLYITLTKVDSGVSNKVDLLITITGKDYYYMNIPFSSEKKYETSYQYPAESNGKYSFKVYDRYGNVYVKEIEVDNIDSTAPTGSCNAVVTSSATSIEVNATDDKGIAGYSYIIDGKATGYGTSNKYQSSGKATTISAKVKDIAGNEATLKCEVEDKSSIIAGSCGGSDVTVTVKACWGGKTLREDLPLEEYILGVLLAEEDPALSDSEEYIKAFIIFARSYTLKKTNYWSGNMTTIRSCSENQNWCDPYEGCYRDQTQAMFDLCIDFALSHPSQNYTAQTCADRMTTFPGQANVSNKTFTVNNPSWTGDRTATSTKVRSSWKKALTGERKEYLERLVRETEGLIIKDADGNPAAVGYYMCDNRTMGSTMCPNTAEKMANEEGYTMEQLIEAYTKNYPGARVECFNK